MSSHATDLAVYAKSSSSSQTWVWVKQDKAKESISLILSFYTATKVSLPFLNFHNREFPV